MFLITVNGAGQSQLLQNHQKFAVVSNRDISFIAAECFWTGGLNSKNYIPKIICENFFRKKSNCKKDIELMFSIVRLSVGI